MFFPILFWILLNVKGLLWSEGNKNTRVNACMFSSHLLVFYIISKCTNKMWLILHRCKLYDFICIYLSLNAILTHYRNKHIICPEMEIRYGKMYNQLVIITKHPDRVGEIFTGLNPFNSSWHTFFLQVFALDYPF